MINQKNNPSAPVEGEGAAAVEKDSKPSDKALLEQAKATANAVRAAGTVVPDAAEDREGQGTAQMLFELYDKVNIASKFSENDDQFRRERAELFERYAFYIADDGGTIRDIAKALLIVNGLIDSSLARRFFPYAQEIFFSFGKSPRTAIPRELIFPPVPEAEAGFDESFRGASQSQYGPDKPAVKVSRRIFAARMGFPRNYDLFVKFKDYLAGDYDSDMNAVPEDRSALMNRSVDELLALKRRFRQEDWLNGISTELYNRVALILMRVYRPSPSRILQDVTVNVVVRALMQGVGKDNLYSLLKAFERNLSKV